MEYIHPNFGTGYARNKGEALYPNLWNNLWGYWSPSMGKQGSYLYDWTNHNGLGSFTTVNPPTWVNTPAYAGPAIQFPSGMAQDGTCKGVIIGQTDAYFPTSNLGFTFACWFNTTLTTDIQWLLISGANGLDSQNDIYLFYNPSNGQFVSGGVFTSAANVEWDVIPGVAQTASSYMCNGQWHLYTITCNPLNNITTLYIDAVVVASTGGTHFFNLTAPRPVWLGAPGNVGTGPWTCGDAGIWTRPLSKDEVTLLYVGATPLTFPNPDGFLASPDIIVPPLPTGSTTVTPSTLSLTTILYAPSITVSSIITPSIFNLTATLYAPIVGQLTTVTPSTFTLTTVLYAPSLIIDSTMTPSTLSLIATLHTPVILPPQGNSISFASKVLAYTTNKLVIVSNTNPVQACFVNTSSPNTPTYTTHTYSGASNATDVGYNSLLGKIYVSCANGVILEITEATPTTFTINNTGTSNNLTSLALLPSFFDIYAGSDETTGEAVSMYEGNATIVSTDMRFQQTVNSLVGIRMNTVQGSEVSTDMRFRAKVSRVLGCDIRFIDEAFADLAITPIARPDFHVYINDIELTDVSLESIEIIHTAEEKSIATFILARKHDNIDFKLDGSSSPITGNPTVKITIAGNQEFGYDTPAYIWDIDMKSQTETVKITSFSELPKQDVRSTINLSIPGINEKLHVFHTLMDDPVIDNPLMLVDDPNPPFYLGVLIDPGYQEIQFATQLTNQFKFGVQTAEQRVNWILGSGDSGITEFNGDFIYFKPDPNYTYFWFVTGINFLNGETLQGTGVDAGAGGGASVDSLLAYIGTSLSPITSDAWDIKDINYWAQRVYPYTKLRGPMPGTSIVYGSDLFGITEFDKNVLRSHSSTSYSGADIDALRFALITASNPQNVGFTSGQYNALNASTKLLDIIDSKFGIRFGTGPFKKVSSKNGWKAPTLTWEDQSDGLYIHEDAGFNYLEYINAIGAIELKKLQNINGTILPKTKCDLEMFLDGYYHFGIELLMRINIDNTTTPNIYNNNNGFPCSVKSIHISAKTMKVTLSCTNAWSRYELLEMESQMPDPNKYVTFELRQRIAKKINPATLLETT